MTAAAADTLHVVAAWLNTQPLPEPSGTYAFRNLNPTVTWETGPDLALRIIATIGGHWETHLPDSAPVTVASRTVDHLGTAIDVRVVVEARLPDLATDAAALGVGA